MLLHKLFITTFKIAEKILEIVRYFVFLVGTKYCVLDILDNPRAMITGHNEIIMGATSSYPGP